MTTLLLLLLGQCVFAGVVVFVLKGALDRELIRAALEEFESKKISSDITEITVRSASGIGEEFKNHLESIRQRKCAQATFNFQEDARLKGGIIITLGDNLLDFSLLSRLQHFWS